MSETNRVFAIVASTPEDEPKAVEVYLEKQDADGFILRGLWNAMGNVLGNIEEGGTLSMLITIAKPGETNSSGSLALNNPSRRLLWEFVVVPHKTEAEQPV